MPESLVVAFTDSTDSPAVRLVAAGHYRRADSTADSEHLLPVTPGSAAPLVVRRIAERGARDALDLGVDVLITADPRAVAYAATRADLVSIPLAWDRAYVLLAPAGLVPNGTPATDPSLAALRVGLASDAVRAEARPAAASDSCLFRPAATSASAGGPSPAMPARIVYPRGDAVAEALAARLMALASDRGTAGTSPIGAVVPSLATAGSALRAEGLPAVDLAAALATGRAMAFVVALPAPAATDSACSPNAGLARLAPWAAARRTAVALVDTRPRLIARRSLAGLPLAWLGAPADTAKAAP